MSTLHAWKYQWICIYIYWYFNFQASSVKFDLIYLKLDKIEKLAWNLGGMESKLSDWLWANQAKSANLTPDLFYDNDNGQIIPNIQSIMKISPEVVCIISKLSSWKQCISEVVMEPVDSGNKIKSVYFLLHIHIHISQQPTGIQKWFTNQNVPLGNELLVKFCIIPLWVHNKTHYESMRRTFNLTNPLPILIAFTTLIIVKSW